MSQLSLERHDDIAVISGGVTLSADFIGRLADLSSAVADDVRVVVLHPDKRVWSGFDGVTDAGDLFAGLAEIAQPTIAVLDGPTFGGGLELALTADIRVAATDCQIGLAALTDGFPRAGGVQRLTRAVGRSRATQLLLLEDQIDSATACEWGLVNLVADDALEAAWQVAGSIASRGPIATRYAKDAIRHGLEMPLAQALHYETELTILLQDTNDRAEGVDAFVNKRAPQFSGT
ncbi:MAG: enoyl-CoA hydratase-related protein [Chloroflexota bacterium]|nr:enoyl-CoA hydratase-related protein [Chloroflexota bacterium]